MWYPWLNAWSKYTVASLIMASVKYGHNDYYDKLVITYF